MRVGTEPDASAQRALRSTILLGSASAVNAVSQMVRGKAIALLLGTSGVALQGLFVSFVSLSATIGGLGIAGGAVREISARRGAQEDYLPHTRVLRDASLMLAFVLLGASFVFGEWLARVVFDGQVSQIEVVVLAVASGASIALASQIALLRAEGHVTRVARLSASVSLAATAVGVCVVWIGGRGVLAYTVALVSLVQVSVAAWFVRSLGLRTSAVSFRDWISIFKGYLAVGLPIVGSVLVVSGTDFLGRYWVLQVSGLDGAGYFQVSRSLSIGLISVLLTTLWSDYFPRLSSIVNDVDQGRRLVVAQTSQLLTLLGPFMVLLAGFADVAVLVLYSGDFGPAVDQLRVQVLGDVFKVASWPLAVYALAVRATRFFFWSQVAWAVVFLGVLRGAVFALGAMAANLAHLVSYLALFLLLVLWARSRCGKGVVRWSSLLGVLSLVSIGAAASVFSAWLGWAVATVSASFLLYRVYRMVAELEGVRSIRQFPSAAVRLLKGHNL